MIASDAIMEDGKGHPRATGTYARVLGKYVRETNAITLNEALRKMTIAPAKRLEAFVPQMAKKGRIQVGADADITIFDPKTVIDRATYTDPALTPLGIKYVIVNGSVTVEDGALVKETKAGTAVRNGN